MSEINKANNISIKKDGFYERLKIPNPKDTGSLGSFTDYTSITDNLEKNHNKKINFKNTINLILGIIGLIAFIISTLRIAIYIYFGI